MHSLYIFPVDPLPPAPSVAALQATLIQAKLLGNRLNNTDFLVGDNFFRQLSFAGCSPSMQLTPSDDPQAQLVTIRLLGPYQPPRLFVSPQYSRPRCVQCQGRIKHWQENAPVCCPNCGAQSALNQLNWRKYAAFGKLLIEVRDIFPGEVLPDESLLQLLAEHHGQAWHYGWAQSST